VRRESSHRGNLHDKPAAATPLLRDNAPIDCYRQRKTSSCWTGGGRQQSTSEKVPHQAHTPPRAFSASFVAGPVLDIADAAPQPTRRLSLRLLRPPPSLPLSSSPSPSPSLLAASLLRRATPTTTTTITASHEEWVRRNWPPGRGTPRWHNRQRLRGERLQIACARRRRRCRRCCRRLRHRRGALRLSRRSRGREAHVAAHQPRLPLESELRRRPRRGHRAVELQVDREQPKPRDQVTPRCASAAARRVADPPRSSSLTPPRPA
jgi:hypothetical protein